MPQNTYLVRPLGKHGKAYLLDKPQYYSYWAFNLFSYLILVGLLLLEFVFPAVYKVQFGWPDNLPIFLVIFSIPTLARIGVLIASRGQEISGDEIKSQTSRGFSTFQLDTRFLLNARQMWLLGSASVILVMLTIIIVFEFFHRGRVPMGLLFFAALCGVVIFRNFRDPRS